MPARLNGILWRLVNISAVGETVWYDMQIEAPDTCPKWDLHFFSLLTQRHSGNFNGVAQYLKN